MHFKDTAYSTGPVKYKWKGNDKAVAKFSVSAAIESTLNMKQLFFMER